MSIFLLYEEPKSSVLVADPEKNLNPDPDPSCFLTLSGIINLLKKSIERYIFQLAYVFYNL